MKVTEPWKVLYPEIDTPRAIAVRPFHWLDPSKLHPKFIEDLGIKDIHNIQVGYCMVGEAGILAYDDKRFFFDFDLTFWIDR